MARSCPLMTSKYSGADGRLVPAQPGDGPQAWRLEPGACRHGIRRLACMHCARSGCESCFWATLGSVDPTRLCFALSRHTLPMECASTRNRKIHTSHRHEHLSKFLRSDWSNGILAPLRSDSSCHDCLKSLGGASRAEFAGGLLELTFVFRPAHYYSPVSAGAQPSPGSELHLLLQRLGIPLSEADAVVLGGDFGDRTEILHSGVLDVERLSWCGPRRRRRRTL